MGHTSVRADLEGRVLERLVAGTSVDLTGVKGSGRTTVLREVADQLEDREWQVVRVQAIASLRERPLEALAVAGLVPAGARGSSLVAGAVEALTGRVENRRSVVVVDDADDLDVVSAGVITAAHSRLRFPVLSASRPLPARLRDPHRLAAEVRPGVELPIAALDYVGTQTLLSELTPAPVPASEVQRVHALSGGIPALVSALAGGVDAELRRTLEPLTQGLSPSAREALETLSLAGTVEVSTARRLVDWDAVEELDECRLLRFLPRDDHAILVGVFPPALAEHRRSRRLTARRVRLDHALTRALSESPDAPPAPATPEPAAALAPNDDAGHEWDAIRNRLLQEHWRREVLLRRAAWEAGPSPLTAVGYVRALLVGGPLVGDEADSVHDVVARTPRAGDPRHLAALDGWDALVRAFVDRDLDGARAVLEGSCATAAEWSPLLRAVEVHLAMLLDGVPLEDVVERFAEPDMPAEAAAALAVVRAERLVFLGDAPGALALLPAQSGGGSDFGLAREVLVGLALLLDSELDEALAWSRRSFDDAVARFDVDGIHGHGYVVAMCLWLGQRTGELRHHLSSVLSSGLASATHRPYEAANLALASGIALDDGRPGAARSFAEQATDRSLGPNPLPAATSAWTLARLDAGREGLVQGDGEREPAEAMWREHEALADRGYAMAAASAGAFAVALHPDDVRAERLLDRLDDIPGGLARHLARFVRAAQATDPADFRREGAALLAAGQVLLGVRTLAAGVRVARRGRGPAAAAEERAAALDLVRGHGSDATDLLVALAPAGELTAREDEVARLAAAGASNQQIAGRLRISVRTVENHLLRAFRKLAVSGRAELADALDR